MILLVIAALLFADFKFAIYERMSKTSEISKKEGQIERAEQTLVSAMLASRWKQQVMMWS